MNTPQLFAIVLTTFSFGLGKKEQVFKSMKSKMMKVPRDIYNQSNVVNGARKCVSGREIIDLLNIKNTSHYNRHRVPLVDGVQVHIGVRVQSISEISDVTQDFVLDMYLSEFWKDPRLRYEQHNPCRQNVSLDKELYDQIWTPNTCFINSKSAHIHESPFKNIFLMVYPDGTLWAQYRVRLQGPCVMRLKRFPMDSQKCYLTFESFNYNTEEVQLRWIDVGIFMKQKQRLLPDFFVVNATASREEVLYPAGYWDEMTMTFTMKRRYGWYVLQVYVPTYLTVFISWISFFLGVQAIPARVMIGVNALLAMTFQFGSIVKNLPRVSYVKAIDVWMLAGMTFVFSSLLELAIIGWSGRYQENESAFEFEKRMSRKRSKRKKRGSPIPALKAITTNGKPESDGLSLDEDAFSGSGFEGIRFPNTNRPSFSCSEDIKLGHHIYFKWCSRILDIKAETVDKISAVVFPTTFAIFNLFYWSYYLMLGDEDD